MLGSACVIVHTLGRGGVRVHVAECVCIKEGGEWMCGVWVFVCEYVLVMCACVRVCICVVCACQLMGVCAPVGLRHVCVCMGGWMCL